MNRILFLVFFLAFQPLFGADFLQLQPLSSSVVSKVHFEVKSFENDWKDFFGERPLPKAQCKGRFTDTWKECQTFEKQNPMVLPADEYTRNRLDCLWEEYVEDNSKCEAQQLVDAYMLALEGTTDDKMAGLIDSPEVYFDSRRGSSDRRNLALKLLLEEHSKMDRPLVSIVDTIDTSKFYATVVFKKQGKYRLEDHAALVVEYAHQGAWRSHFVHLTRKNRNGGSSSSGDGKPEDYFVDCGDRMTALGRVIWTDRCRTDVSPPNHTIVPYYRFATFQFDRHDHEEPLQCVVKGDFEHFPYRTRAGNEYDNCNTYVGRILESFGGRFWKLGWGGPYEVSIRNSFTLWFSGNDLRELIETSSRQPGNSQILLMPNEFKVEYYRNNPGTMDVFSHPIELYNAYADKHNTQ